MSNNLVSISPEKLFQNLKAAIENPSALRYATGSVPSGTIIPLDLSDAFQTFHFSAIALAASKGEYDALMYLAFYVIHQKKLWRSNLPGVGSFRTWEVYCDAMQALPYGLSKTGIKTKISTIRDMIRGGVTLENIVRVLAVAPMAGADVIDIEQPRLPPGGLPEAVENIIEAVEANGPTEATRYVADLAGRATFKVIAHSYSEKSGLFLFTIRTNDRPNNLTRDSECVVKGLGPLEAEWFEARLGRRGYRIR